MGRSSLPVIADVLTVVALPVAAGILGAALAAYRSPGPRLASALQHLAAGVVFAAVATEILPDLTRAGHRPAVVPGFAVGVLLMLALSAWERRTAAGEGGDGGAALPAAELAAVGIDLLVDGFLIGLGYLAGERQGWLLAAALTLEILFLALTVAGRLRARGTGTATAVAVTSGLCLAVPAGAVLGVSLFAGMASGPGFAAVLAFACAALLYLVTEELLAEAHEATPDDAWLAGAFFAGFLAVLLLAG